MCDDIVVYIRNEENVWEEIEINEFYENIFSITTITML